MTSPSTRRLLKESTDLHKNPSPYFTASPTSDSNLHDWHFTLAGPPSPSPYAGGLYHGRITFPPTYPLRPPSFRFLTPSGRFEVNREICLSISGHHEETWQPAWGVRTALLAIRSEIMSSESKGQVGGMEGSDEIRREHARLSTEWMCRECGESNASMMNGLWDACKERGVEIDIEGHESAETATSTTKDSLGQENGEKGDAQAPLAGDGLASRGAATTATGAEEGLDKKLETTQSATAQSNLQPETSETPPQTAGPASAEVAPEVATQARPVAAAPSSAIAQRSPRAVPATATTAISPTPATSPWLDRAIVVIAFTLIVMVLRRVSDVNDL